MHLIKGKDSVMNVISPISRVRHVQLLLADTASLFHALGDPEMLQWEQTPARAARIVVGLK